MLTGIHIFLLLRREYKTYFVIITTLRRIMYSSIKNNKATLNFAQIFQLMINKYPGDEIIDVAMV